MDDEATDGGTENSTELTKKQAWFDFGLVMLVLVVPSLASHVYSRDQFLDQLDFSKDMVTLMAQSLAVIAVCCYIVKHSAMGWNWHGVVKLRPIRDLLLGVGIVAVSWVVWEAVVWSYGATIGFDHLPNVEESVFPVFEGGWHWPLMVLGFILNSFSEEGAIRVIAVTRLHAIFKNQVAAIVVANLIFASYHLYQGHLAAIAVFFYGVVLSLVFAAFRSIWPLVIGHTLANIAVTVTAV